MDLAMPFGIDIPRVIKNGLHPRQTKVSQAFYPLLAD
jgi:hypothetical protein